MKHISYEAYDEHRHPLYIAPESPLAEWYAAAVVGKTETGEDIIQVNR